MEEQTILRTLRFARMVAFPIIGGLLVFWWHGAPTHYALVNSAAFLCGLVAIQFLRLPDSVLANRLTTGAALALLALPLVTGPDVSGVARWLTLGPISLNSGLLLVPLLAIFALRDEASGWLFLTCGLGIAALQPDAAALLALSAALFVWIYVHARWRFIPLVAAGLLGSYFAFKKGSLAPVPFVENVLPFLWHEMGVPTQSLGIALILLAPLYYFLHDRMLMRRDGLMLGAVYASFLSASCIASFPVPLAGYGAASILGLMLGLACTARKEDAEARTP